ncbi:MAG: 50S ribosomal protein L10 [Candidatus Pacebacteria bacterium]|nr:50S ribosomal protein L10 [Candidatus Paceibacterota bacterium]
MITKAKKEAISQKLDAALRDSQSVVFVSFDKLGAEKNNGLRKTLKANNSDYFVARKTLINRAIENTSFPGEKPSLGAGMVALAFGDDLMAPAREIFNFSKENAGTVDILGGIFEGSFKSREEMMTIATIPGMETLRGMFANIINSPRARFAVALGQVAGKKA